MIHYDDNNTIWYNVKDFDKHETGTIIESDDETVLIGTKELHFVAFQDRIFKCINGCAEESDFWSQNFTLDSAQEVDWYNTLQKYVREHGTEFHTAYFLDPDSEDYEKTKGIRFEEKSMGFVLGDDRDAQLKNRRELEYDIRKLKDEGAIDPKHVKNHDKFCFSIDCTDDENRLKYLKQRLESGFDDTETWNLDMTIANFLIPRLERFKELCNGYPETEDCKSFEEWQAIIDEMIFAFRYGSDDSALYEGTPMWEIRDKEVLEKINERIRRGLDLFAKHFRGLWW